MDLGLSGRLALVTGGSRGIGLACAAALLAEGTRVAIVSRSREPIGQALAGLPGATGYTADLSDAQAAERLVEQVEDELGGIDILVNSAGAARRTPPDDLDASHWHAAMEAKFFPYIHVADPAVKRMAQRGRGVIVNVIGMGGKVASPAHLPGGSANAALMLATVGLGHAYAARGVRVVGLNPGLTRTGRVSEGMRAQAALDGVTETQALEAAIRRIPLGRMAEPEEIAQVVAFLASDRASYLTGIVIAMDGAAVPVVM